MNESAIRAIIMLAGMVMLGMEKPIKPYLDRVFLNLPKFKVFYTANRPTILRAVAIIISIGAVLGTDGASIMVAFGKTPVGNLGEIIDIIITGIAVSLGDEGLHNLFDFGRLFVGRDAIDARKNA